MNFRENLIELRKKSGHSQEGLAQILGVSRQSISKWELGSSLPEIEQLIKLSQYFSISIDRMLNDQSCAVELVKRYHQSENLIAFLLEAKRHTYAAHEGGTTPTRLDSHDYSYQKDYFEYYDTYLGSERFSGQEAVWERKKAIWTMNYTGRVLSDLFSGSFLSEALLMGSEDMPYRGPAYFKKGDFTYVCEVDGSLSWFQGKEIIYAHENKIYECFFHGGDVI